jgi:tetratricopeptide (TPR) repeat protein
MKPGIYSFVKIVFLFLILLYAHSSSAAKHPYDYLLHKKYWERVDSVLVIRGRITGGTSYDNAKKEITELQRWARAEDDEELELTFRYIEYFSALMHEHKKNPAIEKEFAAVINELDKKGYKLVVAEAMDAFTFYLWHIARDYNRGFRYSLSAYDIVSKIPVKHFPQKFDLLYDHAGRFYKFRDYETAIEIFLEAKDTWPANRKNKPFYMYNGLALCYRELGMYDSALYYFKQAYQMANEAGNTAYVGIISGNIGITYYYQKKYKEAIPLLETDIRICTERDRASINAAKTMAILADICLFTNDISKAMYLLNWSYSIIDTQNHWDEHSIRYILYTTTAKAWAKQGNMAKAYQFMDSAMVAKNQQAAEHNALILAGARHVIDRERHRVELTQLTDEKERQVLIRNSLMSVILLSGIIGLLFINRQKILHRRNAERLESERKLLDVELENATNQLNQFTKSIHEKNNLIEQFETQLSTIKDEHKIDESDHTDTLQQLQDSTILTDEEWENFRKLFEKVHAGFLWRLKEKLPSLSPAETRFIALSKLKLSNKEMAGMLGISVDAVRMNKHRLRKKLNLPEEETIEELIDQL